MEQSPPPVISWLFYFCVCKYQIMESQILTAQMNGSSRHATAVSLQSIAVIAAGLDFFKFTLVKASSWSTGCGRLEQ